MFIAPKKEAEWGTTGAAGWGDPRSTDPRATGMDPRDMRPDIRDMRAGSSDPMRMLDPREQMRIPGGDMRGDPRGNIIFFSLYIATLLRLLKGSESGSPFNIFFRCILFQYFEIPQPIMKGFYSNLV